MIAIVATSVSMVALAAGSWAGHGGEAGTTDSGLRYRYSADERAFVVETPATNKTTQPPSGPPIEWRFVRSCQGRTLDNLECLSILCETADGRDGSLHQSFARPVGAGGLAWEYRGEVCLGGVRVIELADVEAAAWATLERSFKRIPSPEITSAPPGGGLVNLPVIAWTDDIDNVELDINQPLPGHIVASPSYEWQWSNGERATGPGRAYDPSVSPVADPAAYAATTFTEPGEAQVSLTVTWSATFEVQGLPPVSLSPVVFSSSLEFPIRQGRTVLLDAES
jgi:hypothetical protein